MISSKAKWAAVLAAILFAAWAASASDRPRIWQANLADWDAVLLRSEEPFFVSGVLPVEGLATARLAISGALSPTYERRGAHPGRIRSEAGGMDAWYAPNREWAIGLGARREAWAETHADGTDWSLRADAERKTLPLSLYYHTEAGPSRTRFSALARLLDGERGSWIGALSAAGVGPPGSRWDTEFRLGRNKNQEKWSLTAADPDSGTRAWSAGYRDAVWEAGAYAMREFGFGTVAARGEYSRSRPEFGREEYQLGDSSRSLRAGLDFRPRPAFLGGSWSLRSEYAESQVFSDGVRVPPGASEYKRFHHALGRAISFRSGAEWQSSGPRGPVRFRAGAFHRYYRYRSSPHPDAYTERKETLSYNRLESSFLASLYGGFQQSAELVTADFSLRSIEFAPAVSADLGRWEAEFSFPVSYAWLDARITGETVSRKLLAVDIERRYGWDSRGPLIIATPGIAIRYRQGPAAITARACHALLLRNGLRSGEGEPGTGSAGSGDGDTYPWEGNAVRVEASATLDF